MNRFEVRHLDENPKIDEVIFAILPVDRFTGTVVKRGISAKIQGADHRPRRNLSGMLVFLKRGDSDVPGTSYKVDVEAEDAGYFDQVVDVVYPAGEHPPDDAFLNVVNLIPTPKAAFTNETTLVRGVVRQGGLALAGATISAVESLIEPDPGVDLPFETRSDQKGGFVLPLRLEKRTPGQAGVPSATFWFRFGTALDPAARQLDVQVTDGRPHRFQDPIDLNPVGGGPDPTLVPIRF